MLARRCSYTLKGTAASRVDITIHPCCTIEVAVPDEQQLLASEPGSIHFKLADKGILLVCNEKEAQSPRSVCLHLRRQDAFTLCEHIDDVVEEHEQLMSALSY